VRLSADLRTNLRKKNISATEVKATTHKTTNLGRLIGSTKPGEIIKVVRGIAQNPNFKGDEISAARTSL
jgi:hypothetical protein